MATIVTNLKKGLTYADVLLIPKKTPLTSRSEADTSTRITRNIELAVPFVSANMASVTESSLAIAMAREGGIGVIHQFMSIPDQATEVARVKRSTGYMIENPLTIERDKTIQEALEIMNSHDISSLLVTDGEELIGILTTRDYVFAPHDDLVAQHMTKKEQLITAKSDITIQDAEKILSKHRIEKLPILKDNKLFGLITVQDIKNLQYWKKASRDTFGRLRVGAAIGIKDWRERGQALVAAGVDMLVVDVAHAHSDVIIETIRNLKKTFSIDILAGNIATAQAAKDLIDAGADGIKVGIGPSPVCTTRIISGAGIPQLTAIMDVCSVATPAGVPVCADGGITYPGDVTKAIAAGASTIMSGSLFSGCDESPTPIIKKDGKRVKTYYGSASFENAVNRKELATGKRVKQSFQTFVEGVTKYVDYRGSVKDVIDEYNRGLQSGISYGGARNIKELQETAEFIQVSAAGIVEGMPRF